ncbi:glycoside hydrolase family 15 protein [Streptomyces erythrochromogenes]|uniref:glycoside hydrolase family 15 protein n=1 Tax=Streptomyces erythrochromogenes TaxID=285574 RepID=UPI0034475013
MVYRPIESYGVVGDMHTVALVGLDGSIDWCCLPRFDSPSVFARILDDQKGGYFKLSGPDDSRRQQMYLPDTNVLMTRFLTADGVGEVVDFMPTRESSDDPKDHQIVRIAKCIRGRVDFHLECLPAFNFARSPHKVALEGRGAVFTSDQMSFTLTSRFPLAETPGGVALDFSLAEGESATFILRQVEGQQKAGLPEARIVGDELLRDTVIYWKGWLSQCTYRGRWREMVHRSALTLKLLTYEPTGAIIAAPTTSLPEDFGGTRNWDYRFTWIRDSAFTLLAFMRLGFTQETTQFMRWLEDRAGESTYGEPLQLMYRIDGGHELDEEQLDHLDGYRQSRPVRIGNGAAGQLQLDIYGEILTAIEIYDAEASPISYELWIHLRAMIEWVAESWHRVDEGIWEIRGERQHFTYSKVQCWVALDRGLRMAHRRSFPLDSGRIQRVRDEIYETIMEEGYDHERQAFVQHFGTKALDASLLILPMIGFISPTDPRMVGTLQRITSELMSDSLVYRYEIGKGAGDGLAGGEGTFNICTFWLVEAMARAGDVENARFIFEKMLTYSNHVGLFAEETSSTGESSGNFPQALTHLSLISAAYALDGALGGGIV